MASFLCAKLSFFEKLLGVSDWLGNVVVTDGKDEPVQIEIEKATFGLRGECAQLGEEIELEFLC